jgi:hypothetical protein
MRLNLGFLLLLFAGIGSAKEPENEPVIVVKPDAFKTLVNPQCSHCRDEAKRRAKDLRDDDRILCWIRGKYDGGAIPLRFFLNPYRVISDTYGVFVYDPDAGYARGYAPSLDFTFHGWRNGVMVMKHKDGTLYSCLTGLAFAGPNKGRRLEVMPTLTSDWGFWLKQYPGTVAYHMFDKYQPLELPTKTDADSQKSRPPADERLPADTPVLGVFDGKNARAFPLDRLAKIGVLNYWVNDSRIVILWNAPTRTAVAYSGIADPPEGNKAGNRAVDLGFDAKNTSALFVDLQTSSRWDITGRAVEGELKGWTLRWVDSIQVKWFAWAAEYPETSIYGK